MKFNFAEFWLILLRIFWTFLYNSFHHSKPTTVFPKGVKLIEERVTLIHINLPYRISFAILASLEIITSC